MQKISAQWLSAQGACAEGRKWWRDNGKNPDGVEVLEALIKEGQLEWANWTIVRLMTHKQQIEYAIYAALQVIDNYEKVHPNDGRPRKAIEAAQNYLNEQTEVNRRAADTAWSAADAARSAAWSAAWSAADTARSAADTARSAARSAAWRAADTARSAADTARSAADTARSAARSAADTAWSAADTAWSAAGAARRAAGAARRAALISILNHGIEILKEDK